jgi:hypothetical protein
LNELKQQLTKTKTIKIQERKRPVDGRFVQ